MVKNNRFKIKTPEGYKAFAGIASSEHNSFFEIKLSNDISVKCSGEHLFWTSNNLLIKAKDLLVGFDLKTETGLCEVEEINEIHNFTKMFDIIEVENDEHSFLLANSLKTHNCAFITFELSLISTDILDFYQIPEILEEDVNGFNIFKDKLEHDDGLLVVTIDPSAGGNNSSCLQIWEIAPHKVYEIASFVDEFADASVLFEKLLWLQDYMRTRWQYEPNEALIIFERNGIGEGLAQILTQTEKAIENLEMPIFYDIKGKPGLHITPTLKNKLALQFKNLVEYDKMVIRDGRFIEELYGFIRTAGGAYCAKSGYTDDRVTCSFLMVYYLLNEFANYAMGDFSVDNMLITKKDEKIINTNKEEIDPAKLYKERVEKETLRLEQQKQEELKLIEEAKKQEREYYARMAQNGSSVVEYDEDDDYDPDSDMDKWDILPSVF
jgi:hypothetical protein